MLSFKEFQEHIKEHIKEYLPDEFANAKVTLTTISKLNGVELHGINVMRSLEGQKHGISPTIYLESFYDNYENGMEMDLILEKIANLERQGMNPRKEIEEVANNYTNFDYAKDRVVVTVINAEMNESYLQNKPHRNVEDLAIIYRVLVDEIGDSTASIVVTKDHMDKWGVTEEELHEIAMENSKKILPVYVASMGELMRNLLKEAESNENIDAMPLDSMERGMYVITNNRKVNGVSAILYSDALEQLAEKMGTDLYIFPSSIHEVIVVAANEDRLAEYEETVREVNRADVSREEFLSDHVYKYDAKSRTITIAESYSESRQESAVCEQTEYAAAENEVGRPRHHR